jgi:thioredoxin 1
MNRRTLLLLTATAMAAPMAALASGDEYSPAAVQAALTAGKIVVLDFAASWCSSCRAQGRAIDALRAEYPAYDGAIAFFNVDWDTYGGTTLTDTYGIRERGAIVILKGDQVLAQTSTHSSKNALKVMFDQAIAGS